MLTLFQFGKVIPRQEDEKMSNHVIKPGASLQLIMGCMKSGKTHELLSRLHILENVLKKRICLIRLQGVSRDGIDLENLASRRMGGLTREVLGLEKVSDLKDFSFDVYAFDEGQFMEGLPELVEKLYLRLQKTVMVSILNGKYDQTPFSGSTMCQLLAMASHVDFRTSVCEFCAG